MSEKIREFLAGVELLRFVEPETLDAFSACASLRRVPAGEVLFAEGDSASFIFIVTKGGLDAVASPEAGRESLLRTLGPGDVGGLTSMLLNKRRSATLRASLAAEVLTVPHSDVLRLLSTHPDLSRSLLAAMSGKLRGKTRQLAGLLDARGGGKLRVAFYDCKPYDRDVFGASTESEPYDALHISWLAPRLDAQTAELAAGHHAVCAFVNDNISRKTLTRLSELGVGLVALRCAGFNNVDMQAAAELGIDVVRVPAYSPHAVAEHAMALLLTLNRKVHRAYNRVREGNFSLAGLVGNDLHGQTAGVVGLGKIGVCMARILAGFGMKVLGYDPMASPQNASTWGVELVELDDLMRTSDVVTLHCPLTPSTQRLVNATRLEQMKRGVILINTGRGGLIDTKALIDALKAGHVGAAGLDVYEEESAYFFEDRSDRVIADDVLARLMTFNNVIITSHQAFLTHQALGNIAKTTLDNLLEYAKGARAAELSNWVNPLPS